MDPSLTATPAFAEFGFGFIEIGPISCNATSAPGPIQLNDESIRLETPRAVLTPQAARERMQRNAPFRLPMFARIESASRNEALTKEEVSEIVEAVGEFVDGCIVPLDGVEAVAEVLECDDSTNHGPTILVSICADDWRDESRKQSCVTAVQSGRVSGVVVNAVIDESGSQMLGKPGFDDAVKTVQQIREELGAELTLVGSVGVHCPADALDYLEAGADFVQIDSGLVFAGPGLPKRINEAILYRRLAVEEEMPQGRAVKQSWFWAMLMGLSMLFGGILAMGVASTRVVLPYDEAMSGLTLEQLADVNDHLLLFMTHDRVTLAGTMLAVAIQYVSMAWWGIRRGVHWCYVSVIASAFAGFASFFSFLAFGYFDPFHAFVTTILFQFLLLTAYANVPPRHQMEMPDLRNDARWKANQWGQLLFVIHGGILIVAGLVISAIGMTTVFVAEDLEFMHTTAADLYGAHPQLVPLVAHDRATFGGMLISCGVATLLPAMWGFRRGQAWLWWGLMLAGSTAYIAAILVHWIVGYHSIKHLLPAFGGFALLWLGGLASYRFLVARDEKLENEWSRRLGGQHLLDSTRTKLKRGSE